ncbi:eCIS core domain-containing protein [Streptomyces sp. B21-083]|uniref:eCIS core domain-containing protein n=1 Tax=Streptomyces sp. B21-083 TaxID=3039410 RepID=UPI002FF43CEE
MHSVDREHREAVGRASDATRRTKAPTAMSSAWVRHLQRVAAGGAGRETETTGLPQVQRAAVDEGLRSSSRPLDTALLGEMEERFGGADFSGVRVHDGPAAQRAAASVEARAFTSGVHIVDGGGMSKKDWAHELAHTLDQAAGPVPGTDNGAGLSISSEGDEGERRAVAVADQVMGAPAPVQRLPAEQGHLSDHEEHGHAHPHAHPHAGPASVQRMRQNAATEDSAEPEQAERSSAAEGAGKQAKGAEAIARLSQSIELHTVQKKTKKNVFAPGTWWPEQWMVEGPARLRKTLDRRVMRGEAFNDQDLDDIKHLSEVNAEWLQKVGIGTYEQAEKYSESGFKDWLTLPAGKRVLTATLAVRANHPAVREAGQDTPISPDYTLGRFMLSKASGIGPQEKQDLERERDHQIRETAIDTLYPAGIAHDRRHPAGVPETSPTTAKGKGKGKSTTPTHEAKDARAREMLTKVLLILQHGLKLYDPEAGAHVADYEKDVIRALAHGGRVNIRIPALSSADAPAYSLPEFLGVTQNDRSDTRAGDVVDRGFATHRTSIGDNKEGRPGTFKEKGGLLASATNVVSMGADRPDLWGQDISGGGLGSKDWNGDVVLPNGSYGHMLLIHHRPTTKKDGSLQIGIETLAPHATSPVGYEHDFRSTEATANPESVMHGHKGDKVGSGGLGKNERMVELGEMGRAHPSGDWRTFLDEIKTQWDALLAGTEEGSTERRALYEGLVGPRTQPPS